VLIRGLFIAALIALVGGVAWFGLPDSPSKASEGDVVQSFTLPDLQGKMQQLPKDKYILLNFWATWCPPCRQEMPSMVSLSEKYKSKGLNVIAVSVDRDADALAGFVKEYGLPFTILHDQDSAISTKFGVFRYPETFLIDKHGKIQAHLVGAVEWMSKPIQQGIEDLLAGKDLVNVK